MQEAEDMIVKMKEEGVLPDSLTYTLLIDAYGNLGLTYSAFDVLKRMFDAGCEPSHRTFLSLIKHLLNKKYVKEKGAVTGLYLVSNVVDASDTWKMMKYDIIVEFFDKMLKLGCSPDANTYEKMIIGICKVGNLGVAQRVFDRMQIEGISPSGTIFNALLSCCCTMKKYGEGVELVDDMIRSGHLPQLESCRILICGLYEEGDKEGGLSVFQSLLPCGYYHDEIAWKIIIDGLLKQGLAEASSELFNVMEKSGCNFSPRTYSMLIEGLDAT
ncbi:PREDICTED: pentatricopeptide repeat-containing protein At5g65560-like [Tarenaya hassleriana]|uniref:pentatricopeptide repeat-containing protein At5g65560-like n=1 Tax=Tarenaya hassleriana TaxID=28532 RepID=UPI00053C1BCF|nr:PREDICTED: pentatricopeptide repeat-containing protein At5g65560-like [Tarenaya hassleriana]